MWGYHDGMGWWMVFGGFWSIVLLLTIVWLVSWGAGRAASSSQSPAREDPLDIAKRRLARGEITAEEFERLKRTLQGS